MTEAQTIKFKGIEHNLNDLSDKAKYFISQIQDLQLQIVKSRNKLEQTSIAATAFENLLEKELEKDND